MEERQLFRFIRMNRWGLASWQASFVMSSSQELNCKTFYDARNGCPTSRFSGRGQRWLMNTLGFFPLLIWSDGRIYFNSSSINFNWGLLKKKTAPPRVRPKSKEYMQLENSVMQ